jgi:single-strand DNA-binding protein
MGRVKDHFHEEIERWRDDGYADQQQECAPRSQDEGGYPVIRSGKDQRHTMAIKQESKMAFAQISIIGNIGKDPEIKRLDSGATVGSFSVAVSEKFKKRDGSQSEKTTWFSVDVWQQGENGLVSSVVQPWCKKGGSVFVQGVPTIDEYTKNDVKMKSFKIRLGGPGSTLRLLGGRGDAKAAETSGAANTPATEPGATLDDDIPF